MGQKTTEDTDIEDHELDMDDSETPTERQDREEAEDKATKKKKERPVNLENLVKKFKSPIQGSQRKVQDWEDRTAARLKKMGFRSNGYLCLKFESPEGDITATITSDHAPRSSRGKVKFVQSQPTYVEPAEPMPDAPAPETEVQE